MSDTGLSLAALGAALALIAGIVVPSVRLGIGPMPSSPGARRVIVGLLREKAGPGSPNSGPDGGDWPILLPKHFPIIRLLPSKPRLCRL